MLVPSIMAVREFLKRASAAAELRFEAETLSGVVRDEGEQSTRLELERFSVRKILLSDEDSDDDDSHVRSVVTVLAGSVIAFPPMHPASAKWLARVIAAWADAELSEGTP